MSRAQARYVLLLLVISAFTLDLRFSTSDGISVPFLGLPEAPKSVVNTFAVLVLAVLLVAYAGTFAAVKQAFDKVVARLGAQGEDLEMYFIDQHPNVADFVSYATLAGDRGEGRLTRPVTVVLYPAPIWLFLGVAAASWGRGLGALLRAPWWLL